MRDSVKDNRKSANSLFIDMAEEAVVESEMLADGDRLTDEWSDGFLYTAADDYSMNMNVSNETGEVAANTPVRVALKQKIAIDG